MKKKCIHRKVFNEQKEKKKESEHFPFQFMHTCIHLSNSKKASNPSRNFCLRSSDHSVGLLINTYLDKIKPAINIWISTGILQVATGLIIKQKLT